MGETKIEWTDVTVNPFPGCKKISPGCQNCYAERNAAWLKRMGNPVYQDLVDANGWTGKVGCNLAAMKVPGKGKKVFVNSMGDLFYKGTLDRAVLGIQDEAADRVFAMVAQQPQHTFQVLTKRPDAMRKYFLGKQHEMEAADPDGTWHFRDGRVHPTEQTRLGVFGFRAHWPLRNLWLGTTCENQEWADKRIPILLQIPAAVRFVSFEPLLGPIRFERPFGELEYQNGEHRPVTINPLTTVPCIDWVIVGCESGPKRRPCETQWVADLYLQCEEASVPRLIKQINIDGEVVKEPERIAMELSGYVGQGLAVQDIRQFPNRKD